MLTFSHRGYTIKEKKLYFSNIFVNLGSKMLQSSEVLQILFILKSSFFLLKICEMFIYIWGSFFRRWVGTGLKLYHNLLQFIVFVRSNTWWFGSKNICNNKSIITKLVIEFNTLLYIFLLMDNVKTRLSFFRLPGFYIIITVPFYCTKCAYRQINVYWVMPNANDLRRTRFDKMML